MKTLCQLSGGFDSVAATILAAKQSEKFSTIFFDLNQDYVLEELRAVRAALEVLKKLPNFDKHYHHKIPMMTNISDPERPPEYIPVRNLVLAGHCCNIVVATGYDTITTGNRIVDRFADGRLEFFKNLAEIATRSTEGKKIDFWLPLVEQSTPLTKEETIGIVIEAGIDPTRMWSCYIPGEKFCGQCAHCLEIKKTKYSHFFFD